MKNMKEVNTMSFQDRLIHYRERAGYKSAKDFAKKLGINYTTYMGYENKHREPKFSLLVKMAQLLGVTTDELLGMEPDKLAWIKGQIENNGFNISVAKQKANGESMYLVENLDPNWYDREFFYLSTQDLRDMSENYSPSDQNNHESYLEYFRLFQLDKLRSIFQEIEANSDDGDYYKKLRDTLLEVNPKFFDLFDEE